MKVEVYVTSPSWPHANGSLTVEAILIEFANHAIRTSVLTIARKHASILPPSRVWPTKDRTIGHGVARVCGRAVARLRAHRSALAEGLETLGRGLVALGGAIIGARAIGCIRGDDSVEVDGAASVESFTRIRRSITVGVMGVGVFTEVDGDRVIDGTSDRTKEQ
ncbi:MAG: hypothetical protein AAF799_13535 [Myxococcota bacterium]